MRLFKNIWCFCILLLACDTKPLSNQYDALELAGEWHLNRWERYNTLYFGGDELVIGNHIDTIFRYRYELRSDSLLIYSHQGQQLLHISRIEDLNPKRLVLRDLFDKTESQTYTRTPQ
ncbi:hypothetical protein [Eisenibacter elegans]|jgi:hypothetical protein|uniref:hypothetical protein n=1 Tax=Eisenibacter elegans TaxID=997 RepID=UPI0004290A1F|nr:hypothetical protein [Eisenibacter elegans]